MFIWKYTSEVYCRRREEVIHTRSSYQSIINQLSIINHNQSINPSEFWLDLLFPFKILKLDCRDFGFWWIAESLRNHCGTYKLITKLTSVDCGTYKMIITDCRTYYIQCSGLWQLKTLLLIMKPTRSFWPNENDCGLQWNHRVSVDANIVYNWISQTCSYIELRLEV